jgi:hypothetical protein
MRKKTKNLSEKKYSNHVAVTTTPLEVFLAFKLMSPETPTIESAEDVVTVALPPPIAMALIGALRESLEKQIELLKKKKEEEKGKKK